MKKQHPYTVSVRNVRPTDYGQVTAILNGNLKDKVNWKTGLYKISEVADMDPNALGGQTEFLVATDSSNTVISFITARQMHPDSGFSRTNSFSIYTNPIAQGNGAGSLLMSKLIDRLKSRGSRALVAFIDSANVKSVAWHGRRGFDLSGQLRRVGDRDGQPRDLVLMVRQIDGYEICEGA